MCLELFTLNRKYGAEFPERSEIRFRKSVDFRKLDGFIHNNFRKSEFLINY